MVVKYVLFITLDFVTPQSSISAILVNSVFASLLLYDMAVIQSPGAALWRQ
jgi:hypothetical protein